MAHELHLNNLFAKYAEQRDLRVQACETYEYRKTQYESLLSELDELKTRCSHSQALYFVAQKHLSHCESRETIAWSKFTDFRNRQNRH